MTALVPCVVRPLVCCLALLATSGHAATMEEPSVQSGAWLGACDNLRDCVEYGFSEDDSATLMIDRPAAGPVSGVLLLRVERPLRGQPVHLQVGRRGVPLVLHSPVGSGVVRILLDRREVGVLLPMLRAGPRLALLTPGRGGGRPTPLAMIRLAGVGPEQDWIARQQQRRPEPEAAVRQIVTVGRIGRGEPAVVAGLPEVKACLRRDAEQPGEGVSGYALSAGLSLWEIPCGSGNFDHTSLFVIADSRTRSARPAAFPVPAHYPVAVGALPGTLVDVEIGDDGAVLTATEPSRGLNDCGDLRRYRWDGAGYRLVLARLMTGCHGLAVEDWPVVYRRGGQGAALDPLKAEP